MASSDSIGEPDHSAIQVGTVSLIPLIEVHPEITMRIVSFLDGSDVCSLGSCSKPLRDICNSDDVWKALYMKRWPDHYFQVLCTKPEGKGNWKATYLSRHGEISNAIRSSLVSVSEELDKSNFLEIDKYNEAIEALRGLKLGFEDVCVMFLRRKVHAVMNLVAVHYAYIFLHVSGEDLRNAVSSYQVSERELIMKWALKTPHGYGSKCSNQWYSLVLSFDEITNGEEAIISFLQDGRSMNDVDSITIAPKNILNGPKRMKQPTNIKHNVTY